MQPRPQQQIRVVVPVVSAAAADAVFAAWASHFDVWAGYRYGPRCDWRYPAKMKFCGKLLPSPSFIYIAMAPTGPIKVGLSERPIQRVGALRNYEAIVAIAGQDRDAERRLHTELVDFKVGNRHWAGHLGVKHEWFDRQSPVVSLAYRLASAAESTIEESFASRRGMVA